VSAHRPEPPPTGTAPERLAIDAALRLHKGTLALDTRLRTSEQRVAIVGPSGIGKTTILRILAGLEPEASGRIVVGDSTWESGRVPPWHRGVGWMPQDALLFPHLDVLENLCFGNADPDTARRAAEAVECDHLLGRRPRNLSGGERQRVALARALVSAERILLLDEPFGALDDARRHRVIGAVDRWLADHDVPMVLVSHDARDADGLRCERWILGDGGLERVGRQPAATEDGQAP
jgi:ABC-type sulfate/molybdate transport systems ATPase subunit